jgi:hypothetical protein
MKPGRRAECTLEDMLDALASSAPLEPGIRKAIASALQDKVAEEDRSARHRHGDDGLLLRALVMEALIVRKGFTQAAAAAEVAGDDPDGKRVDALSRYYRRLKKRADVQFVVGGAGADSLLNDVLPAIKAGREPLKPDRRDE